MAKCPHVEVCYSTSTAALLVAEGDKKGTPCLEVQLGHPVTGGHIHGDLVLQLGDWT
jgi:hypothetical protein